MKGFTMLDIAFVRKNADLVKAAAKNKHEKKADIDAIMATDEKRRRIQFETDALRKQLNEKSKSVGAAKKRGENADAILVETKRISDQITQMEKDLHAAEDELQGLMQWVPNIPAADVPVGEDSCGNAEVRRWGQPRPFDFKAKPHYDIGAELDIIDFERGPKISGSGFLLFKGAGALLERALINFMIDVHASRHGYTEILPPYLVLRDSMYATGQIPKLEEDMYKLDKEDLFLIPTAEVPVTNMHRGETMLKDNLPVRYCAYSACFRREAGTYGKDTRGMVRVHQFDKVELVKFVHPATSYDELEKLTADAEKILQMLGLPYRLMKLCTGDLSFASAKTYDIEAYAPGLDRWLEVSSCSNFEDFQARRGMIRFRDEDGKMKFVHTLNGSGVALPRTVVCILENYQQADGSVVIPEVLRPYMRGMDRIGPKPAV
jgi:seryl-tRNA synthetase